MKTIDDVLGEIEALPSSPQILPKLLSALDEPDADIGRIVDLIAYDPGLTSRVLQLCNSAALRGASQVTDISEAVNRVGFQSVYRLVAVASGRAALRPGKSVAGLDPETLWKHSVTAALAAQLIAQDRQEDASGVFTAALLHDAGKIVLAQAYRESYGNLLTGLIEGTTGLSDEETTHFGINHGEAGARLLSRWNFPAPVTAAVGYHHHPSDAGEATRLAACVHLADVVAHSLESPSDERGCPPVTVGALEILGLPADSLAGYRERTLENFEFVNAMCRL